MMDSSNRALWFHLQSLLVMSVAFLWLIPEVSGLSLG